MVHSHHTKLRTPCDGPEGHQGQTAPRPHENRDKEVAQNVFEVKKGVVELFSTLVLCCVNFPAPASCFFFEALPCDNATPPLSGSLAAPTRRDVLRHRAGNNRLAQTPAQRALYGDPFLS